jgi:hypothetical protein
LVPVGQALNCALDLSGAVLSVVGQDGSPLSPDNPCIVGVTDRATVTFDSPASVAFGDDPNTFGSTATRAWNYDRPFFVAACDGNARDYFGISLNPVRGSTGSDAAMLCRPAGTTRCNAQGSLLILVDDTVPLADEINRPCVVIGSFRAQKSSADRWTVTALDQASDGIGRFQDGVTFTMPRGHMGAASGHYLVGSSGAATVPSWPAATVYYFYWVNRNGTARIVFQGGTGGVGSTCTPGSGDDYTVLALPYVARTPAVMSPAGYVRASVEDDIGRLAISSGSSLAFVQTNAGAIRLREWTSTGFIEVSGVMFHAFGP